MRSCSRALGWLVKDSSPCLGMALNSAVSRDGSLKLSPRLGMALNSDEPWDGWLNMAQLTGKRIRGFAGPVALAEGSGSADSPVLCGALCGLRLGRRAVREA